VAFTLGRNRIRLITAWKALKNIARDPGRVRKALQKG
jgi:hypothetical protein